MGNLYLQEMLKASMTLTESNVPSFDVYTDGTFDEYMSKYGDLYDEGVLWDFSEEDLVDGAVEPQEGMTYWKINDRYFETPVED